MNFPNTSSENKGNFSSDSGANQEFFQFLAILAKFLFFSKFLFLFFCFVYSKVELAFLIVVDGFSSFIF